MTQSIKLAIAGIAGRMGRQLASEGLKAGHQIAGATEAPNSDHAGQLISSLISGGPDTAVATDVKEAARTAEVWIDFTSPAATCSAITALRETGVKAAIIGTTGFDAAGEDAIAEAASDLVIVKAGNFSLGVNLLCALTRRAAQSLGEDWDIEVLETHHRRKVDAPSGTALMLGDAAAEARGADLKTLRQPPYDGPDAKRESGKIGFAVRRSGGVIGEHEVTFASDQEVIALSHTALDRAVFANGALAAARWALRQSPGLYNMDDVLGL